MPVAGGEQMGAHGRAGGGGVARRDGVDDPVVLTGARAVVGGGEVQPEEVQVGPEPDDRLVQHPVAGPRGEQVMEPGVLGGEGSDAGIAGGPRR